MAIFLRRLLHDKPMLDFHYTDPDLVSLYDLFNGWGADRDFYLNLLGKTPERVLEVGCGTGLIARAMAARGHDVTGLDPAQAMLDYGSECPGGDAVRFACGTLPDFHDDPFDLIFMAGHAFQCLLTDAAILQSFTKVADLLADDGQFVFETRNPTAAAWSNWTPANTYREKTLDDGTTCSEEHDVISVTRDMVSFRSTYRFHGRSLTSQSMLRFASLDQIACLAHRAGLRMEHVQGDWGHGVLSPHSPEIIVSLRKG